MLKEFKEKIDIFEKEVEEKQKQLTEYCKEKFGELTAEIFERYPELESFSFMAYTDFFNDGDVCEYHIHCDEWNIYINGAYVEDLPEKHTFGPAIKEICGLVNSIPDETFKKMFGDHIEVIVKRGKGVQIEEYVNHD